MNPDLIGSRDDPYRQPRAARDLPLLVHSLSVFQEIFEIVFAHRKISTVAEVGVESGQVSSLYAALGATVYCVEPSPSDDLRAALEADPRLNLVEWPSPAALAEMPVADLYVLDGDHNYVVVREELRWIAENASDALVLLNDVLWPCSRRDAYYMPTGLPAEAMHPVTQDGPTVWHDDVTPAGFLGRDFRFAAHAGGERNGVLTAVEDALAESGAEWRFEIIPAIFGLGVLARDADDLFAALHPYTSSALLATLENNRIALYTRILQMQYEAAAHADETGRWAETIAAQQAEIDELRADLERSAAEVAALRAEAARRPVSARPSPGVGDALSQLSRAVSGQVRRRPR